MSTSPIRYVEARDGLRIVYLSVGEGPAVVFASNIFGYANWYRTGMPHVRTVTDRLVERGWRVVRYDVRGMGASDRDVRDLGLAARVADMEAVVEQLGLERFALCGSDLGAATALAYAVAHPERVSRLALLCPWASGKADTLG
jgi:pimeloyl-ACP methyl ester carboxylesterase